jgi:hypothetical protein
MGTKRNPGSYDCYENAHPDEPMFVLLGRDRDAPGLVMAWADVREEHGEDPVKVAEARACARQMARWKSQQPATAPGCPRCEDPEAPTLHRHPVADDCTCGSVALVNEFRENPSCPVHGQPATDDAPLGEADYNAIIYDVQQELTTLRTRLTKAERDRDHFRRKRAELRKHVRSMQRACAMWKSIAGKAIDQATALRAQQAEVSTPIGKERKP